MEEALLREDAADQERDQQDDRHRLQADAVQVMHHRGKRKLAGRTKTRSSATAVSPRSLHDGDGIGDNVADRYGRDSPGWWREAAWGMSAALSARVTFCTSCSSPR
jgi:hypothetical protein